MVNQISNKILIKDESLFVEKRSIFLEEEYLTINVTLLLNI